MSGDDHTDTEFFAATLSSLDARLKTTKIPIVLVYCLGTVTESGLLVSGTASACGPTREKLALLGRFSKAAGTMINQTLTDTLKYKPGNMPSD